MMENYFYINEHDQANEEKQKRAKVLDQNILQWRMINPNF
jgi:hypothetical protein